MRTSFPNLSDMDELRIIAEESGERIDALLAQNVETLSRSAVQRLIDGGSVLVNGAPVRKNYKCSPGDEIFLVLPESEETELVPQDIPLDVVYEDGDVIVVNKPRGMVVHPAAGHPDGTLVNALMHYCGDTLSGIGGEKRPGIVHRIDKDTSGLLLVAKNDEAQLKLARQFYVHSIERCYNAIVWGNIKEDEGTIDANIGRDPNDRLRFRTYDDPQKGKRAVTHYRVLERFGYVTLVECRLETGRTHQIRVHMASIGHPLFADERYGGMEIRKGTIYAKYRQFIRNCFEICPRQALHARTLGFVHPTTGKTMSFSSELPEDMTRLLDRWRRYCANMPEEDETE